MTYILFVVITTIQGGITSQQIEVKDRAECDKVAHAISVSAPSGSTVSTSCLEIARKP